MLGEIINIAHGDQTSEAPVVIDEQQLLNAAAIQNRLGKRRRCVSRRGYQLIFGHHVLDARLSRMIDKANIAPGQDANHARASGAVFGDGKSADAVFTHQLLSALHGVRGRKRDGIGNDSVLCSLDFLNLERLSLRRNIFVDDADAALLSQCNGERRLGHRVHGRRDQRDIQADPPGELCPRISRLWRDLAVARNQQDIVKGDSVLDNLVLHLRDVTEPARAVHGRGTVSAVRATLRVSPDGRPRVVDQVSGSVRKPAEDGQCGHDPSPAFLRSKWNRMGSPLRR